MPFGSILANADKVKFTTADNQTVVLSSKITKLGLRLIGIPHIGLRVRARAVLSLLNAKPGEVVLDAGCGSGAYSFTLGFKGVTVYGVDMDKEKIKQCQKMSEEMAAGNRTYFYKADITKLPFDNNFFDKILFSETLEHIKDEKKAIEELYRVLKPNGKLIISVPSDIYINQKYKKDFDHERLYNLEMLQKTLNKKFRILAVVRRNRLLGQLAWLLNRRMFFNKILAAATFYPLYLLTYLDFYGPARELIVKVEKCL